MLIVEDDADARELLVTLLEGAEAQVLAVSCVQDALRQLTSACPDVVVSDIGMAGETGYDLIRQVRTQGPEGQRRLPVIALTAYARTDDRTRALMMGFDAHLTKPVDAARLFSTIVQLAPRPLKQEKVQGGRS